MLVLALKSARVHGHLINKVDQPCCRFRQELQASCINVNSLKRLGFHGVPSAPGLRALVWKVGQEHLDSKLTSKKLRQTFLEPDSIYPPPPAWAGVCAHSLEWWQVRGADIFFGGKDRRLKPCQVMRTHDLAWSLLCPIRV